MKKTNSKKPKSKTKKPGDLQRFLLELFPRLRENELAEAVLDAAQTSGVLSQAEVNDARLKKTQPQAAPA